MSAQVALSICLSAHEGQTDKGGQPYARHPMRVSEAVALAGYGEAEVSAALLHDVVEDTHWTLDGLRTVGFPDEVVEAVDCLTQRRKESAPDYYARVMTSRIAHVVKWYDVADNASEDRMALLAPETQERLRAKYVKARGWLVGAPEVVA